MDRSCPANSSIRGATDFLGFVEQAEAGRIAGWAIDRARLPGPAQVAVLAADGPVAIAWADRPRPDVQLAGFPATICGFDIGLPPSLAWPPRVVFWPDLVPIPPVEGLALAAVPQAGPRRGRRLGVVSSWYPGCGIADYARHVVAALAGEFKVIVLARDPAGPDGSLPIADAAADPPGVEMVLCWQDSAAGLDTLCETIAARPCDLLLIEHHPGLLAWPRLGLLIEHAHALGSAVFVRLHTSRTSLDALREIRPALRLCAGLLVHTAADAAAIEAALPGLATRTVAHGMAPPPAIRATARSRPAQGGARSGAALHVGAFGFMHRYKGVAEHLLALHLLRRRLPNLRATLLHALTDDPATVETAVACFDLRRRLELEDIVDIDTRLLPMDAVAARLGGCDVLVFPYQDSAESASGAIRAVASLGVPLLCTPSAIFDDMRDVCHVTAAPDAYAIAGTLLRLAGDRAALRATLPALHAHARRYAWAGMAGELASFMRHAA